MKNIWRGREFKNFSKEHYANILNVFLSEMPKISSKNDIYYTWNILHF